VIKRIAYISFFLITVGFPLHSQQFPIYSQYWTNKFLLNPAIAGHEGYTSFNLTARRQWAGLPDAPATVAVSGQTRYVKNSHISRGRGLFKHKSRRKRGMSRGGKVGYGGYVFSNNMGVLNKTGFQATYAYHLALRKSGLSFGLSAVGLQYKINKDEIRLHPDEPEDELINYTAEKGYFIDGNFGVYYSDKNLYAGFSTQNLFESFFKFNKTDSSAQIRLERQYILMAGYRYEINRDIYIEPSFNLKFSENVVAQTDINATLYFQQNYWGGLAYRTGSTSKVSTETLGGKGSSLIFYGGARIDKFFIGYSFDYTFSSLQKNTYGSHEIMLAVRFGDNARRYRWLNRY
jgi:type IX secretion system PorP/SprF family membrane protein